MPAEPFSSLDRYREKRSADRTPEPFGGGGGARPRLFVVQKHAARALHYDLRLEMAGVLRSWAVPKGPSLDPKDKRFAAAVEDHPIEYADFEGVIPAGNYGAGPVIVWDRGTWVPEGDPEEGYASGKLLFELRGHKLRGVWTLVKTRSRGSKDNSWLLMKKPDAFAVAGGGGLAEESILSGLSIEEVRSGSSRATDVRAELERKGAKRAPVRAGGVEVMLAESQDEPFSAKGWVFELKYDGYRLIAGREGGRARLVSRRGNDLTSTFPDLARAIAALPFDAVMDGEVVALDEQGRPSFQRLQGRSHLLRARDAERAAVEAPATLFLFDLLGLEDLDLRPLPLLERKAALRKLLPRVGPLRYADHIETRGLDVFAEVRRLGLEGMVAKKADEPYRGGRTRAWLKVRIERTGDFAVVGYTAPRGTRSGFGALHLAAFDQGELTYVGRVGSGFDERELATTRARLEEAPRKDPPCRGDPPRGRGHFWVEPRLVCEVRYREWTEDELLRQPTFVRFRDDKAPSDCVLERAAAAEPAPAPAPAPPTVAFTNRDKVFWPDEGFTKGDLCDYYGAIAPWLLPYLRDRPVVLTRYPDGIAGKSFYQHDAPGFVPEWLRRERIFSQSDRREIEHFVCDDEASLLYLANLGTIPLHVWSSRVSSLARPDWCVLDLDPKGAPFKDVVAVARAIRSLCESIGLPSYAKTSGSSGLHVLLPLGGRCTHEEARVLAELVARIVEREHGKIATTERAIEARGGRVYVDFLQNGQGKLIAAPFCVRPLPGAPVSTPLRWSEVTAQLDPRRFTIATVPRRMKRMRDDPLRAVLEEKPDLRGALEKLSKRLEA